MKEYKETSFGFDVYLKNVEICKDETHGDYAIINYNDLAKKVLKSLVLSDGKFTGAKLRFARKQINKSLRELGEYLDVAHSTIKEWEDRRDSFVGMTSEQERAFRLLCVKTMVREEEDEMEKIIRKVSLTEKDMGVAA